MTTAQLKQPFEIYEMNVGRYLLKTPPSRMLQLLCRCGDHPVFNKEVCALLNVNHSSASKLLKKLCRAGLVQHSGLEGAVELTDHGRKLLTDLELAMATIAATTPMQERSSPECPQGAEAESEQPANSSSPIRLDELEARIGTLISKLGAKPAGQSEEPKPELPPKLRPMPVSRRHQDVDLDRQLSLSLDSFAA